MFKGKAALYKSMKDKKTGGSIHYLIAIGDSYEEVDNYRQEIDSKGIYKIKKWDGPIPNGGIKVNNQIALKFGIPLNPIPLPEKIECIVCGGMLSIEDAVPVYAWEDEDNKILSDDLIGNAHEDCVETGKS